MSDPFYDYYSGRAPLNLDDLPTAEEIETLVYTYFTEPAVKDDSSKADLSLLDRVALEELARVMTFGAKKYGRNNWRQGMDHSRYIAAALRHLNQYNDGQNNDQDSGLSHLAHAMANCMILLRYVADGVGDDNRYKEEQV